MKASYWITAAALLTATVSAGAQNMWGEDGWGAGYGTGMGLGRTEGPVKVDVYSGSGSFSVAVTVSGCGGVRDFRGFGTDIAAGEGQTRDIRGAIVRLLGEARRACSFEERLATRIADGFEPAFDSWIEEQEAMNDMNMTMDMNATCEGDTCNAM